MAADKQYVLGNNARELLRYTNRITKPRSDEVSASDVRAILKKIAALDDIREVRAVCEATINAVDRKTKEGFSKRAYADYGKDMRQMCKDIMRHIHSANGKLFETEHDERLEQIGESLDECSLLMEYITACLEMGYIDLKTSQIWTKKVTDVKYPAGAWKKKDGARAEKIRSAQRAREDRRQIDIVKAAIREVKAEPRRPPG